eukprot:2744264-Prymnesium_polylepis.1
MYANVATASACSRGCGSCGSSCRRWSRASTTRPPTMSRRATPSAWRSATPGSWSRSMLAQWGVRVH